MQRFGHYLFSGILIVAADDCTHVIEQLGNVYHNDAIARDRQMTDDERLAYHRHHSGPVMQDLQVWCTRQIEEKTVEPKSGLGKAINYMLKRWKN